MSNILLFPGSFNPITNAHIEIAKIAQEKINAEKVLFVPAHDKYVAKKKKVIYGDIRCKLINESTPADMYALSIEVDSVKPKKTYDTVDVVRKMNIGKDIYICLGVDNVKTLTTWYNWKQFVKENKFVICSRNEVSLEEVLRESEVKEYEHNFTEISIPKNNISSSLVRELCSRGEMDRVKKIVPINVYQYLRRLYDGI